MTTFKRILLLIAFIIITGCLYELSFDKIINLNSSIRYYSTDMGGSTVKDLILVLDAAALPVSMLLVVMKSHFWHMGMMNVNSLLDPIILIIVCSLINALYFLPYQKLIKRKPQRS